MDKKSSMVDMDAAPSSPFPPTLPAAAATPPAKSTTAVARNAKLAFQPLSTSHSRAGAPKSANPTGRSATPSAETIEQVKEREAAAKLREENAKLLQQLAKTEDFSCQLESLKQLNVSGFSQLKQDMETQFEIFTHRVASEELNSVRTELHAVQESYQRLKFESEQETSRLRSQRELEESQSKEAVAEVQGKVAQLEGENKSLREEWTDEVSKLNERLSKQEAEATTHQKTLLDDLAHWRGKCDELIEARERHVVEIRQLSEEKAALEATLHDVEEQFAESTERQKILEEQIFAAQQECETLKSTATKIAAAVPSESRESSSMMPPGDAARRNGGPSSAAACTSLEAARRRLKCRNANIADEATSQTHRIEELEQLRNALNQKVH